MICFGSLGQRCCPAGMDNPKLFVEQPSAKRTGTSMSRSLIGRRSLHWQASYRLIVLRLNLCRKTELQSLDARRSSAIRISLDGSHSKRSASESAYPSIPETQKMLHGWECPAAT